MDDIKKEVPKTQEQIDDETYSPTEYKKSVFTFSKEELDELAPLEQATGLVNTFITVGAIAQKMKDAYVNNQVLVRLGVKKSPDSKFNYDMVNKKIIVYEPRYWCSKCDIKKAGYKYEEKAYCKECLDLLRQEVGKPIEKKKKG